ncbi:MAG: TonB-dependent receptor plug domain-containing protein, partial [Desulfobacterales bacterium]|nr:TonB-dependent receptor plug domain-containing protein [Desulfobacterales bacterium]
MRRSCNALFVLLYAFLCCPSQAVGGEPATLKPLVVTATREKALQSDVAANISVITAEEIANLPVSTVAEALQYVPGMYVDSQFGVGWNLTARIQGSEPRHVAVYKDGVPMNLLVNPVADLSRISVQNIERNDIYKGAA